MKKPKFSVGRFQPKDKNAWTELWKGYVPSQATTSIIKSNWKAIMADNDGLRAFKLHTSGRSVGFALYNFQHYTKSVHGECYVADVYVAPEYRGQGGGKHLIEKIVKECRRKKVFRIWWITAKANAKAQNLYNSFVKSTDWKRYIIITNKA